MNMISSPVHLLYLSGNSTDKHCMGRIQGKDNKRATIKAGLEEQLWLVQL